MIHVRLLLSLSVAALAAMASGADQPAPKVKPETVEKIKAAKVGTITMTEASKAMPSAVKHVRESTITGVPACKPSSAASSGVAARNMMSSRASCTE